MTVEHPPLDQLQSQKQQEALQQLQEITGIRDPQSLQKALDASREEDGYDLYQAVDLLLGGKLPVSPPQEGPARPEDGDLQKAIALSLQDQKVLGGQVTQEERDISRVLEATLGPSPPPPQREGETPVGLKNVGNTCWFSSVIQSLFHLPIFRRLVLNFSPQDNWDTELHNSIAKRNVLFMLEMRKLFALMTKSRRKYVDPSQAIEILREAFPSGTSGTDSQQDVSEFSHKLLEWLEEAFKLDTAEHATPDNHATVSRNPMLNLFYGHFMSEGHNNGHFFSTRETFGQYPLQVNNYSDIHDSLQAAMSPDLEGKSAQESWFTQLPPVLLFELSRFQFNQHLGRPEKIHNKLEFPQVIYMDRYMEYNKNKTKMKREQVRHLKEQREYYQRKLEKYLHYGPRQVPLQDILQSTLDFAGQSGADPSPSHVEPGELEVLQSCLLRWRKDVLAQVQELEEKVAKIGQEILDIYNEPSLKQVPFKLHAVLVHEGQAASGHYWAYIWHHRLQTWLKFNDVAVVEASWVELQRESMGGHHHASAYCLLYVDARCTDLFDDEKDITLPSELEEYVARDNTALQQELEGSVASAQLRSLRMDHVAWLVPQSRPLLQQANTLVATLGPRPALEQVVKQERSRLEQLAKDTVEGRGDHRLHHLAVYMMVNKLMADSPCVRLAVWDQLAYSQDSTEDPRWAALRKEAAVMADQLLWQIEQDYTSWQQDYSSFLRLASMFVQASNLMVAEKDEEALPHLITACQLNAKRKGQHCLPADLLHTLRRRCLLRVSESAAQQFQANGPKLTAGCLEAISMVKDFVVPCMEVLEQDGEEDRKAAEEIRGRWCGLLGEDTLHHLKQEKLEELLSWLLEPSTVTISSPRTAHPVRFPDLEARYSSILASLPR